MQAVQEDALFDDYLMSQVLITMSVAVLVAQWTTRRKVGPVVANATCIPCLQTALTYGTLPQTALALALRPQSSTRVPT